MDLVCLVPPRHDFLCSTILDGLRVLPIHTQVFSLMNGAGEREVEACKAADRILLFSNVNYEERKRFVLDAKVCHKTVYIDGSDGILLEDDEAPQYFEWIFKREMTADSKSGRVKALPFGAEAAYFQENDRGIKDIPLSCMMNTGTNKRREEVETFLKGKEIPNAVVRKVGQANAYTPSHDPKKQEYYNVLARSKISVNWYGSGFDTARCWEIMANRAVLVSPPIMVKLPVPLIADMDYIVYENLTELNDKIDMLLHDDSIRIQVAINGYNQVLCFHTGVERVKQMLYNIQ